MMFTLHGTVPSKKNSKQIRYRHGRFSLSSSDRFLAWHHEQMLSSGLKKLKPITGAIASIELTFFLDSKRRRDLTNCAEGVMDLLVEAGILEDDNCFIVPQVNLVYGGIDKKNPRVEGTIFTL